MAAAHRRVNQPEATTNCNRLSPIARKNVAISNRQVMLLPASLHRVSPETGAMVLVTEAALVAVAAAVRVVEATGLAGPAALVRSLVVKR